MTTPLVVSTSAQAYPASGGKTYSINIPAGSTGDMLLIGVSANTSSTSPISMPVGWTERVNEVTGTAITGAVFYRITDGTEGSTVDVTLNAVNQSVSFMYRISGFSDVPEATFLANTSNTSSPITTITPSYGTSDYLFIAFDFIDTYTANVTAFPTGYTDTGSVESGTGSACEIAYAQKATTGTTGDSPSEFTLSAARNTLTSLVAIPGVSSGTPVSVSDSTTNTDSSANSDAISLVGAFDVSEQSTNTNTASNSDLITLAALVNVSDSVGNSNTESSNDLILTVGKFNIDDSVTNSNSTSNTDTVLLSTLISVNDSASNTSSSSLSDTILTVGKFEVAEQSTNSNTSSNNDSVSFSSLVSVSDSASNSNSTSAADTVLLFGSVNILENNSNTSTNSNQDSVKLSGLFSINDLTASSISLSTNDSVQIGEFNFFVNPETNITAKSLSRNITARTYSTNING